MIYRQTGFKSNVLKTINTNKTALETLASTNAPTISQDEDIKQYKANNMMYFISGDIKPNEDGSYTRNDSNLKTRNLIVIDIEDTDLTSQEVQAIIQEKLASYKYLLYSTISHKPNNPRLRLVLEPNRDIIKDEYKPTIQHVIQLLNINYDKSSCTWSQLQGLPIAVRDNEFIFIKHLDGLPYPVQKAVRENKMVKPNNTASNVQNNNILVSDEAFKSMFERYLVIDYENIKPGAPNEYNRILTILLALSRDVCYKVISYDVACECSDLLANIGATPEEYKQGNLDKINHAINCWEKDNNYFNNEKSYSMLDKFKIIGDETLKNEVDKYFSFNNSSTVSLGNNSNLYVKNLSDNSILEIETNKEGKVIQTLENLEKMILSITPIAYNELKEIIEVTESNGKVKQLADRHKELLRSAIEKKYKIKVNAIDLKTALVGASERYKYHPIKSKILSTEWDGIPRAERFFINVFGVEDNVYNCECTRKWFLAGVYRAFEPGTKFDEMLIIHGEQGLGKSTTFRKLSLDCHLEPTEEIKEELMRKALRSWIVELSELATMKKTDSDTFKAWLSTPVDCVKKLYDRDPQDYPRSFIVCGTTNEKEILKDRTGNRRYWLMYGELERRTLDIKNVDEEYILQLWSEVYQWYKNKETLLISDETKLYMKKLSSGALEHNPLEERINSILEMKVPNNWHDFIIDSGSRFNYYNHVNDYVSFGKSDSRFPQETQITDITTGELLYLLSDNSPSFHTDMRGNKLAKDINKVMNNLPNWKKSESIKRSYNKRGLKGFVRKLK